MLHMFIYIFIQDDNDFLLSVDPHKIILPSLCGAILSFSSVLALPNTTRTNIFLISLFKLKNSCTVNKIFMDRKKRRKVAVVKSNKNVLQNLCTKR